MWVPGSVVLPEEFEAIDEIRPWMINGDGGSTNAPTTQIVLGGQGLRVSGPSRLDGITLGTLAATGVFTISDNSRLDVAGGAVGGLIKLGTGAVPARIDLDGANSEIRVKNGTFISVQVGGAIDVRGAITWTGGSVSVGTGSTWVFDAGSTVNQSGTWYFSSGTWPKLSPARSWSRRGLNIATVTYDVGGSGPPDRPNSWKVPLLGGGDQIETRSTTSTGTYTLLEFVDLPENGTLLQYEIACIGADAGTVGMTFPKFQAVRWRGSSLTTMSAIASDTHVLGNWSLLGIATTITITSDAIINRDYRYGLVVYHAYYTGSTAGRGYFYDCVATGTAEDLRV